MNIMAIKLDGYREWTESLGNDREWKIQLTQDKFAYAMDIVVSKENGFFMPLRRDMSLVLLGNYSRKALYKITYTAKLYSPVDIRTCVRGDPSPFRAQVQATYCVRNAEETEETLRSTLDSTKIVAVHFDFNLNSERSSHLSIFESYLEIWNDFSYVAKRLEKIGGISQYLGGDNMIAFIPTESIEESLGITNDIDSLKAGVGIGVTPREAIAKAAISLSKIRKQRDRRWVITESSF